MSSLGVIARFEPIRQIAAASVLVTYVAVGTQLLNACRQYTIYNGTNALLMFSFDGINDHFVVPSLGGVINDLTSNKTIDEGLSVPKNAQLWVKQIGVATTGSVYFTVMYGSQV